MVLSESLNCPRIPYALNLASLTLSQNGPKPAQETADERWRPILGVHSILISVRRPLLVAEGLLDFMVGV